MADNMEMLYAYDGANTRILVWSQAGNSFTGEFLTVNSQVVSLEMATFEGQPVALEVLPTEFALEQNDHRVVHATKFKELCSSTNPLFFARLLIKHVTICSYSDLPLLLASQTWCFHYVLDRNGWRFLCGCCRLDPSVPTRSTSFE
jgi:hypothetical protein